MQYEEHYHHERNHQGKGNVCLFPAVSQDPERQAQSSVVNALAASSNTMSVRLHKLSCRKSFQSLAYGRVQAAACMHIVDSMPEEQ